MPKVIKDKSTFTMNDAHSISVEDKNTINYDVIQKMEEEWPEMTEEFMKEEKKITSQFDSDPLLKLKSREVDLRAMENERKKDNDMAQQDLARARLMQQGEIAEDKMEQNEDLAKLRAGVSLAKAGAQQATIVTEDN